MIASVFSVLILKAISPGVANYFLDGRHPGRWSPPATKLLGLCGPVERSDLVAVLSGRDPRTGDSLPAHRPGRRRAGWDLAFCSPKSLSLLVAMSDQNRESVIAAHVGAVDAVMAHLGSGLAGEGLVAAAFDHTSNGAGEPHVHTHVLVANLSCVDGRWSALRDHRWYVDRQAIGATYHLALREQLAGRGWDLEWRLRPDGLADLADVPRAAVRAASGQSRLGARLRAPAASAKAETRAWRPEVVEAGMPELSPCIAGGARASLDDPALVRAVATRLAVRRSDFRLADVVVALAATCQGGANPDRAWAWVGRFCESAVEVRSPTAGRRWTTRMAARADEELAGALAGLRRTREPVALGPEEERLVHLLAPSAWQAARQLLGSDAPVSVLSATPGTSLLLSQAEAMHACREIWEGTGQRVALCGSDRTSELRWAALSGLQPVKHGESADVFVVDQADRRTTAELLRLVDRAASANARLVLIEGGTLPRLSNPASHGLVTAAGALHHVHCGPHIPWQAAAPAGPAPVGRAAAENALLAWLEAGERAVLVGLGIEEVRGLNVSALSLAASAGPSIENHWGTLRAGERAVVLRTGVERPPYGTFGTVEVVDTRKQWASVVWDGAPGTWQCDRKVLSGVGPGYAVTARLASICRYGAIILGPAESAPGIDRSRILWSAPLRPDTEARRLAVGM